MKKFEIHPLARVTWNTDAEETQALIMFYDKFWLKNAGLRRSKEYIETYLRDVIDGTVSRKGNSPGFWDMLIKSWSRFRSKSRHSRR